MKTRCRSIIQSLSGLTIRSVSGLPVRGRSAGGRVSELTRGSCSRLAMVPWVAATQVPSAVPSSWRETGFSRSLA